MLSSQPPATTHQQFTYLNSKLIFYFSHGRPRPGNGKENTRHSVELNAGVRDHRRKDRQVGTADGARILRGNRGMTANRDSKEQTGQIKGAREPKMQAQSQVKVEVGNGDVRGMKGRQSKRPSRNASVVEKDKNKQKEEEPALRKVLSHEQIRGIFGSFHHFYRQNKDYLHQTGHNNDNEASQFLLPCLKQPLAQQPQYYQCLPDPLCAPMHSLLPKQCQLRALAPSPRFQASFNHMLPLSGHSPHLSDPRPRLFPLVLPPTPSTLASLLPWTRFLTTLYSLQPQLFLRLISKPSAQQFAIWLYTDGRYQRVIVSAHMQTMEPGWLWLWVIVKAVCRLRQITEMAAAAKLKQEELYEMLTGLHMKTVEIDNLQKCEGKIISLFNKKVLKQKKYHSLLYKTSKNLYQLHQGQNGEGFVLKSDTESTTLHSQMACKQNGRLLLVPCFQNYHITEFQFLPSQIVKYQLQCQQECSVFLNYGSSDSESAKIRPKLCIYRANSAKSRDKQQLVLFDYLTRQHSVILPAGCYEAFTEDETVAMGAINPGCIRTPASKTPKKGKTKPINALFLSSTPIGLSPGEVLTSQHGRLQDKHSIYQCGLV